MDWKESICINQKNWPIIFLWLLLPKLPCYWLRDQAHSIWKKVYTFIFSVEIFTRIGKSLMQMPTMEKRSRNKTCHKRTLSQPTIQPSVCVFYTVACTNYKINKFSTSTCSICKQKKTQHVPWHPVETLAFHLLARIWSMCVRTFFHHQPEMLLCAIFFIGQTNEKHELTWKNAGLRLMGLMRI